MPGIRKIVCNKKTEVEVVPAVHFSGASGGGDICFVFTVRQIQLLLLLLLLLLMQLVTLTLGYRCSCALASVTIDAPVACVTCAMAAAIGILIHFGAVWRGHELALA